MSDICSWQPPPSESTPKKPQPPLPGPHYSLATALGGGDVKPGYGVSEVSCSDAQRTYSSTQDWLGCLNSTLIEQPKQAGTEIWMLVSTTELLWLERVEVEDGRFGDGVGVGHKWLNMSWLDYCPLLHLTVQEWRKNSREACSTEELTFDECTAGM